MKIGMLWFDNDPKATMDQKIQKAVDYYKDVRGMVATTCYVHPSMTEGQPETDGKIVLAKVEVRTSRSIMPNHFWIGVD